MRIGSCAPHRTRSVVNQCARGRQASGRNDNWHARNKLWERILTGTGIIYHYGLWSLSWVIERNEGHKRE